MLREYKAGHTTEEVFSRVLGTDLKAFDRKFDAYMKGRFKDARPVATGELLEAAKLLADSGRADQAIAVLWMAVNQDETTLPAHLALARELERQGDLRKTADVLERSLYIDPFDVSVHKKLASLFSGLGDRAKAVRERRAVVASGPVDLADALFELAMAQMEAGDAAGAKASVIRALEEAPNFAKAQELLLTLVDGRKP
jgi:Tfp pilus assembly protein PilF